MGRTAHGFSRCGDWVHRGIAARAVMFGHSGALLQVLVIFRQCGAWLQVRTERAQGIKCCDVMEDLGMQAGSAMFGLCRAWRQVLCCLGRPGHCCRSMASGAVLSG